VSVGVTDGTVVGATDGAIDGTTDGVVVGVTDGKVVGATDGAVDGTTKDWPLFTAPKEEAVGPAQEKAARLLPVPARCNDKPSAEDDWSTPMSADVKPTAGPLAAVMVPSYEMNSTTAPAASTSAMPSLGPFWMPECKKLSTPKPACWLGMTPSSCLVMYEVPLLPL